MLWLSSGPSGTLSCGKLGTQSIFSSMPASTAPNSSSRVAMRSPRRRVSSLASSALNCRLFIWVRKASAGCPAASTRPRSPSSFFRLPSQAPICFELSLRWRRNSSTSWMIPRRRASAATMSSIGARSSPNRASCCRTQSGFSRIKLMSIMSSSPQRKTPFVGQDEGGSWCHLVLPRSGDGSRRRPTGLCAR